MQRAYGYFRLALISTPNIKAEETALITLENLN